MDDASRGHRLHRGFVADMLIAFGVLGVDVIVDNDGLRVLGELLDFILQVQDVSDY